MPNPPADPVPASVNTIRRRLISASPDAKKDSAPADEAIDFDAISESGLLKDLQKPGKGAGAVGHDEVEALLQRYQAEKGVAPAEPPAPAQSLTGARRASGVTDLRSFAAMVQTDVARPAPGRSLSLPPLTTAGNAELERLRADNTEMKQLITEYREALEANDPTVWEQKVAHAEQIAAEREEQVKVLRARMDEWDEKFKTHRFVPQDDELAQTADELDKERSKLVQERKQLEADRQQLKDDEETMMKQMRDMEVGMAKDRAELARQRTELQRLQAEIKHTMDLMQRGDAGVKERLAVFQRRYQDALTRPSAPPSATPPIASAPTPPPTAAPPAAPEPPRPRDSSVFKRLFGQG